MSSATKRPDCVGIPYALAIRMKLLLPLLLACFAFSASAQEGLIYLGAGAEANRPVVLLIHGIDYDPAQLKEPLELIREKSSERYFFRWSKADSFNLLVEKVTSSLLVLLTNYPEKKILVLAHSAGGVLALRALDQIQSENLRGLDRLRVVTAGAPVAGYGAPKNATAMSALGLFMDNVTLEIGVGQKDKFRNKKLSNSNKDSINRQT